MAAPSPSPRPHVRQEHASVALGTGAALGTLATHRMVHASGSDEFRIALVGCGGRGTGAAVNALSTQAQVRLVAMADAFQSQLDRSLAVLQKRKGKLVDVPPERRFVGLDAYQHAIDCDIDVVLLCTPPGFRPDHFAAAVNAGRHVFMEKPVAVDAPGVRRILRTNQLAKEKGLAVAVGHHLRHEKKHQEVIRRLQQGVIGDIDVMRAYFCSSGVWVRPRAAVESEMHYQIRNWYYFTWLSGDHIVEQHVHDLDVINWCKNGHPISANGMGGRQVRIGKDYGEIFDHHSVEFTYADGSKLLSFSRHIPNCWNSFSQHFHGTRGTASIQGHGTAVLNVERRESRKWKRDRDGHQVEHEDLFAALLAGKPYNEADYGAESTMTAILGRMATYSGQEVTWNEAMQSDLSLGPKKLAFDAEAPVNPGDDGLYACAIPGVTRAY